MLKPNRMFQNTNKLKMYSSTYFEDKSVDVLPCLSSKYFAIFRWKYFGLWTERFGIDQLNFTREQNTWEHSKC